MLDIVKGVPGSGRTLLIGWILPFGLVTVLFAGLVLPSLQRIRSVDTLLALAGSQQGLVFVGLVLAGGALLDTVRPVLYRVLEGYLFWPTSLADARRQRHLERRERIRTAARQKEGLRRALAAEHGRRYPANPREISPTQLGNAIRRIETYAFDRYRLDSQMLWSELRSVAPESAARQEENARVTVDFFVCLLYSALLLGIGALAALLAGLPGTFRLTLTVVLAAVVTAAAYRGAVVTTDGWASAVRALVNLGRIPLAHSLGLALPATLDAEREMWRRVNWLVRLDFDERIQAELNPYRVADTDPSGSKTRGTSGSRGAPE